VTEPGQEPPATRGAERRKKASRWRKIRRTVYALVALGIIVPIVAFMVAYVVITVPQPSDLKTNQVATMFAQDGKTQLARLVPQDGNRTDVTIADIPTPVRFAVLSAEDRSFYSNPGFSVSGTARAVMNDLTGGDRQGGSTITQQYVKNALTGDSQTLTRKLKELVTSTKLARQTSKDDTLTAYLNTIYFGRGAYGSPLPPRATSARRRRTSPSPRVQCSPRPSAAPVRWIPPTTPKRRSNAGPTCSTAWCPKGGCRPPTVRHRRIPRCCPPPTSTSRRERRGRTG